MNDGCVSIRRVPEPEPAPALSPSPGPVYKRPAEPETLDTLRAQLSELDSRPAVFGFGSGWARAIRRRDLVDAIERAEHSAQG